MLYLVCIPCSVLYFGLCSLFKLAWNKLCQMYVGVFLFPGQAGMEQVVSDVVFLFPVQSGMEQVVSNV